MKRVTVLCIASMAVAALLSGCAPSKASIDPNASLAAGSLWPPVMYPASPGVVYEVPDPGFDGYDAQAVWSMCVTQITEWYPQLAPDSGIEYNFFFLNSVAMPGTAPIDFNVRIPMQIRNTSKVGTMVCYVSGGPASPFVAAIAPYGF
jgi:hypothetical protein